MFKTGFTTKSMSSYLTDEGVKVVVGKADRPPRMINFKIIDPEGGDPLTFKEDTFSLLALYDLHASYVQKERMATSGRSGNYCGEVRCDGPTAWTQDAEYW